jgi:hypothetical protein
MAPERLLGVRDDPRSDLFHWACCCISSPPACGRSARAKRCAACAPAVARSHPPRKLKADYPPWLQEIVLRCLEIEPVWRHPTASQLAFELAHPEQVKLTARSERLRRDPLSTVWRRRFNRGLTTLPKPKSDVAAQLASGPIVAVAIDTEEGSGALNECLRRTAAQLLSTLPSARLACLNVLRLGRVTIDRTLDEQGNNAPDRLVALRHWAQPLQLDESRLTVHVLEAIDPRRPFWNSGVNQVDHIVIGARQNSCCARCLAVYRPKWRPKPPA